MKAVIFDLDGTLIDSAPDIHAAANKMLALQGHDPLSLSTITSFIGNGIPKLVERVLDHVGIDQTNHGTMLADMMDIYGKASSDLTVLYPGVWPLLKRLKAKGIKIGLCTNKPYAPTIDILRDYLLTDLFDVVIGGDSLPTKKPDAAPLLEAIKQLDETEVLYVGDSEVDYQTAQNAKVPFAFFTGGYRKKPRDYFQECWHFDHFDQLRLALTPPKAYLFDVDGTLAETEEIHRQAFNEAFAEKGLDWNWDQDEYRVLLKTSGGKERIKAFITKTPAAPRLSDQEIAELHALKTHHYTQLTSQGAMSPRDGVLETIKAAQDAGLTLAICTTTSRANIDALVHSFWKCAPEDIFAGIYCAENAPIKKPDPQVYLKALADLNLDASEALAFEDSTNGLNAARAAKLDVIVTPALYTNHEDHSQATDILPDLQAFLRKYHSFFV